MKRRSLTAAVAILTIASASDDGVRSCPLGPESPPSDPARVAGPAGAASSWALGSEFSHLISVETSNYDSDCNPWLLADESELFFIRFSGLFGPADPEYQGSWDIYHAERDTTTGAWGPVTNLGPSINTAAGERRPTATVTGDTLFFARGGSIHYSIRTAGEFGPATQLFQGSDPCLSSDSRRIYYVRQNDIWLADRGPSGAVDHWVDHRSVGPPVNTPAAEVRPYISRDGTLLLFSDFGGPRPGGYGDADLWVSTWIGPGWGPPQNVGPPINIDRPACTPWLSADGNRLYTSSEASEGSRGVEDVWIAFRNASPEPAVVNAPPGTWTQLGELDGAWNVYDLIVDASGSLYAGTSPAGRVYRSDDGGESWAATGTLPGALIVYSLLAASDGALYAGTYPNGDVFRSSNGGATWQLTAELPGETAVRALLETTDGRILAGTSPDCRVFATATGGTTWSELGATVSMTNSVTRLFEASDGTLYAGGWGRPNRSTNGGLTWTPFYGFAGMGSIESFLEASDGTLWMTGWGHNEGGFVALSTDGGLGWSLAGPVEIDSLRAVRVYDIAETAAGELMIGFQPGPERVASRSTDGGSSWVPEGALAGAHEILRFLTLGDGTLLATTTPNGDIFRWTPGVTAIEPGPAAAGRPGVAAVLGGTPNPFRVATTIAYQVPGDGGVDLSIVDAQGRHVRTLELDAVRSGKHERRWDGADDSGVRVAAGVYFARLAAGASVTFQKLVIVR